MVDSVDKHIKTPATFMWGMTLIFTPTVISIFSILTGRPTAPWAQIVMVVVIIACVGLGTYLAFWGKRPRQRRGDWLPSDTIPESNSK